MSIERFVSGFRPLGAPGKRELACSCFVLSTGRVGSLTLATLFKLSRKLYAYHDRDVRVPLYSLSRLAYELYPSHIERLSIVFKAVRGHLLRHARACGVVYCETSPQVTFLAHAIAEALPGAKFIHAVRDPRAVVRSGMRRRWYRGHICDVNRIVPRCDDAANATWEEWSAFEKNAWLWAETNRFIRRFCDTLDPRHWMRLHSESVFSGDMDVLGQLFEFLGGKMPRERRIRKMLSRQINEQVTGQFPRPEEWPEHLHAQLEMIAGDEMDHYGYERRCQIQTETAEPCTIK